MKIKTIKIDFLAAIEHSWEILWASNVRKQKENGDYRGSSYFLVASDLANQVRACGQATHDGKPWPTTPDNYYGMGQYGWRFAGGDVLNEVRRWLANQANRRKLQCHNFSRGHVSGMRYRPAGAPLSPAEEKTLKKKEDRRTNPRPTLWHYAQTYSGQILCTAKRKKQSMYSPRHRPAFSSPNRKEVTCPRCIKLLPSNFDGVWTELLNNSELRETFACTK